MNTLSGAVTQTDYIDIFKKIIDMSGRSAGYIQQTTT